MRRSSIPRRHHEQILADVHRRHQQELDQVKAKLGEAEARLSALSADRERMRAERDQFAKDRDRIAAEAKATAARLEQDLVTASGGESKEALRRRIRQLEKQYDEAVGLKPGRIEDSSRWQPGYQMAKQDTV